MLHRRAAQGTQTPRRGERTQPIFRTIFGAMMLVLVAEILLLVISIYVTNVGGRLNQNAKDMLAMQVRNRVGYMQDLMQNAQDLTDLSDYIDRATLSMVNTGRLDLDALNTDSEQSSALLAAIAPELVNTLRARSVTGIFVVLNTEDLRILDVGSGVPGIYLRDLDPDARPSEENADLLIERGSAAVVKALGITTDKSWQPVLRYYGLKGRGFFKEPFLRAYEDNARLSEEYYGRWTTSAYTISDDDRSAIAYSQPLILPDGTVYGVVGVELLTSYVQEKMPYEELQNEKRGAYFLVSTTADEDAEEFVVSKSVTSSQDSYALEAPESMMRCERRADGCWLNLHKRDYDILTGLYNRQAFQRVCGELFEDPQQLGTAALLMMDLDNLKHINDTYGHDWGDQYIHCTGLCLAENTPAGTVVARLSGDEFMLLFYGYPGREQIREKVRILSDAMQKSVAVLPGGSELRISISGGMAWYPEDSRDMETLKKYADFALYQVKHSHKGCLQEFSMESYRREAQTAQLRRDFQQLLTEERVYYMFPAYDGRVMAYEALMRSDMERLRSPATIMKLAREQGALQEIERLTFFKSLETFDHLRSEGLVRRDALLFINSIASIALPREDSEYMDSRWHELRRQMVIEITEEEAIDREAMETKRHAPGFSGMFALDDYGSGYFNEGSLLELSPRFIKVDLTIIRGIDTDPDKQQIVQNIVAYAHPRSMQIIAEGVETAEELKKVLELGVDGLQGYFLAKPANIPARIAPAARQIIENSHTSDCG